ncbi:hypothetical protein [Acidithiobacillus thiooxidans]|uniref:hypothetical protein n=1 Tax=Acidithiobacillus thiooxidans TaxID=930 RepID=UPI0004E15C08|nr:hypothetical protein [Acidithiobacillus thiooxidans]
MFENTAENQAFIDAAKARGEDTFMYKDHKTESFLLVSGAPESIRLLAEIIDDYEMLSEVAEDIATELERLHLRSE